MRIADMTEANVIWSLKTIPFGPTLYVKWKNEQLVFSFSHLLDVRVYKVKLLRIVISAPRYDECHQRTKNAMHETPHEFFHIE